MTIMNYRQFLDQVRQYTIHFFKSKETQKLLYHNLEHTQMVVANAEQIARHYQLAGKDFFIVMTAAWFHDSGYLTGDPADHEQRSADIAARFLNDIAGRGRDNPGCTSMYIGHPNAAISDIPS